MDKTATEVEPMELPQQGLLSTLAEVSAAFVGFSMIVSLFRTRADSKSRVLSVRDVAETSLVIAGAALAPILVFEFGLSEETAWGASSAVLSVAWLSLTFVAIRRFVRFGVFDAIPKVLWFGPASQFVAHPLLWWNVLRPDSLSGARYILVLVLFLAFAGLSFVVATFHGRDD